MAEEQAPQAGRKRRSKRLLAPSQKYEIWLQLLRQEVTMAEAATAAGVDRSTIVRIRTVAKDGALAALAASKPGAGTTVRDSELAAAQAEVARLSEAIKELAVKLTLAEGKTVGAKWPSPEPGRRGHQGGAARAARPGSAGWLEPAAGLPPAGPARAARQPVAGAPGRRPAHRRPTRRAGAARHPGRGDRGHSVRVRDVGTPQHQE